MFFKPLSVAFLTHSSGSPKTTLRPVQQTRPFVHALQATTMTGGSVENSTEAAFMDENPPMSAASATGALSALRTPTYMDSHGNYRDDETVFNSANEHLLSQPLYAKQSELPNLPVPRLRDVIKNLVPTALPLAESDEEAAAFQAACDSFKEQAQPLQERLQERFEKCKDTSWLQEWWNVQGYLQIRDSLPMASSYFFYLDTDIDFAPADDESILDTKCLARSAAMLHGAATFAASVADGSRPVDTFGKKQTPLCSTQYKYLFNTCRIPGIVQDAVRVYDSDKYKHAIVASRGQFYTVPLYDESGNALKPGQLKSLLKQITEMSATDSGEGALEFGWLSAINRDDWALSRRKLWCMSQEMREALEWIESSVMMINLDVDDAPQSTQEAALVFWHGNFNDRITRNRWWDKSMQVVVTKNGRVSYLGEHSMADGMTPVPFCEHILAQEIQQDEEPVSSTSIPIMNVFKKATADLSDAQKASVQALIDQAKTDFHQITNEFEMHVVDFRDFGKDYIQSSGIAGDSYAQLAMQLAIYRLLGGKLVGTYESSQTRPFLHGRTETVRTVSEPCLNWCKAMNDDGATVEEKRKLLQEAAWAHVKFAMAAAKATGVDRHMYGLSQVIQHADETPDLFKDPLFIRSKTWTLSTSTLDTSPGYGPSTPDGFGIGYSVRDNTCLFLVSSRKENNHTEKMSELIAQSLREMRELTETKDEEAGP